ncbi:hypothetical protein AVL59_18840 [Streptomyces griseochromogenes]|uniref:Uncharacterized protein n=1 Tax=Streptomyces griseochromogenes TaxID=68214 RepID=A0A1B1AXW9_9ACTN|nr:hypothetical protein AVL59_18840 [Streptomyces griseochromogenes]
MEQVLREDPDDLAAWRAYIDVLQEWNDPRGRLVELELHLAREVRHDEREALQREIDQLTQRHQESWDAELPEGVKAVARRYGFATKVAVDWSQQAPARIAEALRSRFVTALRIRPGTAAEEADAEYWSDEPDYDENDMPLPPPPHEAGALADVDFGGIRELDLSYFRIADPGAKSLAAAASAGRIETLDLRYCAIGSDGAAALATSGNFSDVRRLHLQYNRLTGDGVRALARFGRLEELDLRYNRIGADGAQALIEAPFTGSLKRLLLYRHDVSDAGAKKLASAPQLPTTLRSIWRSV